MPTHIRPKSETPACAGMTGGVNAGMAVCARGQTKSRLLTLQVSVQPTHAPDRPTVEELQPIC